MLTVPEAAKRVRRDPETVRRWIRAGVLRSTKVGTQYVVDEADLRSVAGIDTTTPTPDWMRHRPDGRPQPDWVRIVQDSRRAH